MKEPLKYRIVVEWSDDDQAFVARVPALPGCAAHGATAEKATREAERAAARMLDVLREDGRPLPPEDSSADYSGQLRLRLPKSLHEGVAARDRGGRLAEHPAALAHRRGVRAEGAQVAEDAPKTARKRKVVPALTWYQATRHTFASQFVLGDGSIERLSELMGQGGCSSPKIVKSVPFAGVAQW